MNRFRLHGRCPAARFHWWEYVHWTTQGWHGAYNNGSYLMNDSYCFAEKWM